MIFFQCLLLMATSALAQETSSTVINFISANHERLENLADGAVLKFGMTEEITNLQAKLDIYLVNHPKLDPTTCQISLGDPAQSTFNNSIGAYPAWEQNFIEKYNHLGDNRSGHFPFGLNSTNHLQPAIPSTARAQKDFDGLADLKQVLIQFSKNAESRSEHINKVLINRSLLNEYKISFSEFIYFLKTNLGIENSQIEEASESASNAVSCTYKKNSEPFSIVQFRYQYLDIHCTKKKKHRPVPAEIIPPSPITVAPPSPIVSPPVQLKTLGKHAYLHSSRFFSWGRHKRSVKFSFKRNRRHMFRCPRSH